jgi:hypothetical protein
MNIALDFHVEASEGAITWWVESEELPGVNAAADGLGELREILEDLLRDLGNERGEEIVVVSERLAVDVDEDAEADGQLLTDADRQGDAPLTRPATQPRQVLVSV